MRFPDSLPTFEYSPSRGKSPLCFAKQPFQVSIISSFSLIPAIHMHHSGLNLGWDIASRRQGSNSAVAACEKSSCLTSGFLSSPRGAAGGCWLVGPSKLLGGASAGGRWLWWPGGDCACGLAWSAWPGGIRPPSLSRGRPSSSSARLHCASVLCTSLCQCLGGGGGG